MFKLKPSFLPKLHIEIERWKYLESMDVYISSYGRFKDKNGEFLSVGARNNYLVFRGESVHRLVLSTFKPIPGWAGLTVDHLNHNTRDNRVSNLEWVTLAENTRRARKDENDNTKTMLQKTEEKIKAAEEIKAAEMKATTANDGIYVVLNGVKLPIDAACQLMKSDKSLSADKINTLIKNIKENAKRDYAYGNWKIRGMEAGIPNN